MLAPERGHYDMISNVRGRVKNTQLPKSQALLPLFEAIINSIDAIEDIKNDVSDGLISIKIISAQEELFDSTEGAGQRNYAPINGFEITDNGMGFTKEHYDAFNEADTRYREKSGGKGVGRFIWLKAFKRVEIESVHKDNDKWFQRNFTFSLSTPQGITDDSVVPLDEADGERTTVKLLYLAPEYEVDLPRNPNVIAYRIVEHCLEYFILQKMPKIILVDSDDHKFDLDEVYDQLVASKDATHSEFAIRGIKFDVAHFLLHHQPHFRHSLNFCANKRLVTQKRLQDRVANLPSAIKNADRDGEYIYTAYVTSDYLDHAVNQVRTDFEIMPEDGFEVPGELKWNEIEDGALERVREYLSPFTTVVREQKVERIRKYIAEEAPQYRYILKRHPEELDAIAPDVSNEKLDSQLYTITRDIEVALRAEAKTLLPDVEPTSDGYDLEQELHKLSQWYSEANEVGKSALAKYIVHRKQILTTLERVLKIQPTGKYSREDVIHTIIFPLRATSDDITYDQHNLWVIDEKLSYHEYLASDTTLRKNEKLDNDSQSRPDIIVFFDRPIAVVDEETPFNSGIVIFEFKRPMRDDYTGDDNPIHQVLQYVQEIRDGKARTKDGRPIQIPDRTPFYCYIVCDPTEELKEQAKLANLTRTPDDLGFFGYYKEFGAYIEVSGFDKLLMDAKKRNKILFDKLNLPVKLDGAAN